MVRAPNTTRPHVYTWLRDYKVKSNDRSVEKSHTLTDARINGCLGGCVYVPDDKLTDFYTRCASDWEEGRLMHMNELPKKTTFKLFFDFDMLFAENDMVDSDTLGDLFDTLYIVVSNLFDETDDPTTIQPTNLRSDSGELIDDELVMCVAGAEPSPKTKNDKVYNKLGLHIFWPRIYVDIPTLAATRECVIAELKSDTSPGVVAITSRLQSSWEDVIDLQVVKSPSCRMIGSSKLEKCHCKTPAECKDAGHRCGLVDVGRIYKMLGFTTIVVTEAEPMVCKYKFTGTNLESLLLASLRDDGNKTRCNIDHSIVTRAGVGLNTRKRRTSCKSVPEDIYDLITAFIWQCWSVEDGRSITNIEQTKTMYLVSVISQYCINKGCEHTSNSNYYVFDSKTGFVTRLCRSNNGIDRLYGHCDRFHAKRRIPHRMFCVIFPGKKIVPITRTTTDCKLPSPGYHDKHEFDDLIHATYKSFIRDKRQPKEDEEAIEKGDAT